MHHLFVISYLPFHNKICFMLMHVWDMAYTYTHKETTTLLVFIMSNHAQLPCLLESKALQQEKNTLPF